MSEQIKTTTVDQLPEATNLDGLYVFGYASKNAVGKRSVKAPITLLKGNKGETGAAGKDGKDGEITADQLKDALTSDENLATEVTNGLMSASDKKQLNEIIENMKTDVERYDTTLIIGLNNDTAGQSHGIATLVKSGVIPIEYKIKAQNYELISLYEGNSSIAVGAVASQQREIFSLFVNGINQLGGGFSSNIEYMSISSKSKTFTNLSLSNTPILVVDLTGAMYLRYIYAERSKVKTLSTRSCEVLASLVARASSLLETVEITSSVITTLHLHECPKLSKINIVNPLNELKTLRLNDSPLITKDILMSIEDKWTSRVGKDSGLLFISQSLFETLADDDKKKFTDKNISIQF